MRKGVLVVLVILAAAAVAAGGYYRYGSRIPAPEVTTLAVSRGDVAEVVGATGTLEALTTVQVGTQVSGTVQSLYADFNSIVHKGQVVARLDPSLFETQVAQGRANLVRAQADVERQKVALEDAQTKAKRARELQAQGLVPALELENAEAALGSAQAQLRSSQAQLVQAEASLNQSAVNLQHTVIEAPIDGIVISRDVDVGQTVAASMQAPTLFVIAADLTKMRVAADVDESDVGRIRPGQSVSFRVDAYPNEEFSGTVVQVRLQPKVTQNVVTYATVIDVPNRQLKLKPGMTATVRLEIARRADVVRVPVAALRFRPSPEMFEALNQPVPPELQRGGAARPGGAEGATNNAGSGAPPAATTAPAAQSTPAPAAGAATGSTPPSAGSAAPGAPRGGPAATTGNESPRQGAGQGSSRGRRGDAGAEAREGGPRQPQEGGQGAEGMRRRPREGGGEGGRSAREGAGTGGTPPPAAAATAQTVDSLFGPLPVTETRGRVWTFVGGQLKPVNVRLGISDGTYTELISGDLEPGAEVVSSLILPAQAAANSTAGRSPLMGPTRGGPGGGRPPGR